MTPKYLFFFYPHPSTCLLILKGGKGGKEEGRETPMGKRNIGQLPLVSAPTRTNPKTQACALAWNQTHDLLVYGTTLQPTEPHWPGLDLFYITQSFKVFSFPLKLFKCKWKLSK